MVVKKSMLVFVLTALLCGVGVSAEMQTNLITNPDMALDDGVGIPAGWGTCVFPAEMAARIARSAAAKVNCSSSPSAT